MSDPWNYHINLGTENGRFLPRWNMYTKWDVNVCILSKWWFFDYQAFSLLKAMSNLPKEHV